MVTRKNWFWYALIAVIFFTAAPAAAGIVSGFVLAGGYLLSLWIHPFIACRACGATGRAGGRVFAYSHRQCGSCGGQGRHRRLGTVLFYRGRPVQAESRAARARDTRRNRPL